MKNQINLDKIDADNLKKTNEAIEKFPDPDPVEPSERTKKAFDIFYGKRVKPHCISGPSGKLNEKMRKKYNEEWKFVRGIVGVSNPERCVNQKYLTIHYAKYPSDPFYRWDLPLGELIEIPRFLADHINSMFTHKFGYKTANDKFLSSEGPIPGNNALGVISKQQPYTFSYSLDQP